MAITEKAKTVIERPLDPSRIKSRSGGQGMTFDYIGTEHAIQLLNEAFDYAWDSRVVEHEIYDSIAVALVELKVWDTTGSPIIKQQFGSCNINRGVDTGAALKGAASDGLKKCASQLGVALELYLDELPAPGGFKAPSKPAAPSVPPAPRPVPGPAAAPTAPPRPPSAPPARTAPPAAPPPAPPTSARPNPFQGGNNTASLPKPPAPVSAPSARPVAPPPVSASVAASRPNPFGGNDSSKGITTVQMSALTSLAAKKGVSQTDLIALAEVSDAQGSPKQTFEELTHSEAIEVVKAAQR